MNGYLSKPPLYREGFSEGFNYAWQLSSEQLKAAISTRDQEIMRLKRLLKANNNLAESAKLKENVNE